MFHQVNSGATTNVQPHTAFHRRDGGANTLTGIRASHSAFIKRRAADDPATSEAGSVTTAVKRLAPAQTAAPTVAQGTKDMRQRPGLSVALDVLESSEEGRAILAKLKESESGLDIFYMKETGDRAYVYVGGLEKEYWEAHDRVTERKIAALTADSVEISDEGRELAANQIRIIDKDMLNEMGSGLSALKLRVNDPDNPSIEFPDGFWETVAQSKAWSGLALSVGPEGTDTLQRLAFDALKYKTDPDTARKFITQLDSLINGTYDDGGEPNEPLEKRVINREKGIELAKYIADNYIDNPADRQKFLDGVKQFANNAEKRDIKPLEYTFKIFYTPLAGGGYSESRVEMTPEQKAVAKAHAEEITRAIAQIKKSMNMDAIKKDVQSIVKDILANSVN